VLEVLRRAFRDKAHVPVARGLETSFGHLQPYEIRWNFRQFSLASA
jgi:hypothetical protein